MHFLRLQETTFECMKKFIAGYQVEKDLISKWVVLGRFGTRVKSTINQKTFERKLPD